MDGSLRPGIIIILDFDNSCGMLRRSINSRCVQIFLETRTGHSVFRVSAKSYFTYLD